MNCLKCYDTGVIETGNNDLPCECEAGDRTVFNEACVGPVTGAEIKQHYYNGSPEPLDGVPERGNALVVDDDDSVREYVTKALTLGGYKVTAVKDGMEGLRQYHEQDDNFFSIIVSDWSMPRMMGTEMVRRIRRHDKVQKILMMSSEPQSPRRELQDMHITDVKVLFKSFSGAELLREVLNVVQGNPCEFAK